MDLANIGFTLSLPIIDGNEPASDNTEVCKHRPSTSTKLCKFCQLPLFSVIIYFETFMVYKYKHNPA